MHTTNESQDSIYARYKKDEPASVTIFNRQSRAYRFTNEPLADVLDAKLPADAPSLIITGAGDAPCLFAGMGSNEIHCVDISERSNAWCEYKFGAFTQMPYEKFSAALIDSHATWSTFPFDIPVSSLAKGIFEPHRESGKNLINTQAIFFDQGYAGSIAESAGYTEQDRYAAMQQNAMHATIRFYLTDLTKFFEKERVPDGYFGAAYLSNMLDHTKDPETGLFDFSTTRMLPVLKPVTQRLRKDGAIVLNIQWGDRAKKGIDEALDQLGFGMRVLPNNYIGCGRMYVATRKA